MGETNVTNGEAVRRWIEPIGNTLTDNQLKNLLGLLCTKKWLPNVVDDDMEQAKERNPK